MQNQSESELDKLFTKTCRLHNLKITPQRFAIYKEILKSDKHPSVEEIYQAVKTDLQNISFDTVNRTLLTFSKIGLVDIVESYRGIRRFDPNKTDHHHIHCIKCGAIIDFEYEDYNQLEIPSDINRKYTVLSKRVVLNVICNKCLKK